MANTPANLRTLALAASSGMPYGTLITITDANRALRVTVPAERPVIVTTQFKTTAGYVIWDDSVATDAVVSAANHLEVPAAAAPEWLLGGSGSGGLVNRTTGFSVASASAGQTVWIGVREAGA